MMGKEILLGLLELTTDVAERIIWNIINLINNLLDRINYPSKDKDLVKKKKVWSFVFFVVDSWLATEEAES